MTRILVIGGGIAGTAAALALHKAGLDATVYEAHPDTGADIGAFLTLASNGMRALAQFDAAEPVARAGFPITSMNVVDESGTELAAMPLGEPDHPLTRYRCLRRAELGTVLRAEVRQRGIPIRHAARLRTVTETATDITAHFADGSSATGDLLIGADGLRSTVRSSLDPRPVSDRGDPHAAGPSYAGQRVFYGYSTAAPPPSAVPERITMVRGSAAAFGYLVSPSSETFWFARVAGPPVTAEEAAELTPGQWRDWLLPLLRPDRTETADIVAGTGDELMVTNALHLTPGLRWHTGRAVLLGDAAHAASPATGQGASMALEDAVVLAKALRDAPTRAAALARYELHRRPRTERNMAVSAQLTASRTPAAAAAPRDSENPAPRDSENPAPRDSERPASRVDEELLRLLTWDTPLPEA
ncbi:FAD-binding protein [Kitasatospora acidiphila]|uniref:FAD-binding protein n=1 Tax=Kitasatospora acidiphila TaxID=2567942 RepID=A0A540VXS4_9ACTN|nr:FAD-dependent oxidoreductase [Kitasatospora acidiphila]TQF01566.1 FAD-binding protein [Kitasatospora acidiphila]